MNELMISQQYPAEKYNLLGNTDIIVKIPDIKSPVVQAVKLNVRPGGGDVYIQQKANKEWTDGNGKYHPATPDLYAITKNGLKNWPMEPGSKWFPVNMSYLLPVKNAWL